MSDQGAPEHGKNGLEPTGKIQDFIFTRELAEVYLLIDNVSTSTDKALVGVAGGQGLEKLEAPAWIKQICQIGWPPSGTVLEQAEQAAVLMTVRDRLNILADPADGATIAFTLLVAGEDSAAVGSRDSMMRRGRTGETASREEPSASPQVAWLSNAPSRRSLASLAFPGLIKKAYDFRRWMMVLVAGLFIWLMTTCLLSWNVAVGSALLTNINTMSTQRDDVYKQIADAQTAEGHQTSDGKTDTATANPAIAEDQKPVYRYCDRPKLLARDSPPTTPPLERFDTVTEMRLCDQKFVADKQYQVAEEGAREWLGVWRIILPIPKQSAAVQSNFSPSARGGSAASAMADNDIQWVIVLVGVLSSAVLPVAYGMLGAGAAVLRNLSRKMKNSLLSPRDLQLTLVQLALGALIGACIGLFVTPSGSTQNSSQNLISDIPMSASALCFIAGFGVEHVFVALEGFLDRIFNIPAPEKKAPPPS